MVPSNIFSQASRTHVNAGAFWASTSGVSLAARRGPCPHRARAPERTLKRRDGTTSRAMYVGHRGWSAEWRRGADPHTTPSRRRLGAGRPKGAEGAEGVGCRAPGGAAGAKGVRRRAPGGAAGAEGAERRAPGGAAGAEGIWASDPRRVLKASGVVSRCWCGACRAETRVHSHRISRISCSRCCVKSLRGNNS